MCIWIHKLDSLLRLLASGSLALQQKSTNNDRSAVANSKICTLNTDLLETLCELHINLNMLILDNFISANFWKIGWYTMSFFRKVKKNIQLEVQLEVRLELDSNSMLGTVHYLLGGGGWVIFRYFIFFHCYPLLVKRKISCPPLWLVINFKVPPSRINYEMKNKGTAFSLLRESFCQLFA
jgi:hypothetical protein